MNEVCEYERNASCTPSFRNLSPSVGDPPAVISALFSAVGAASRFPALGEETRCHVSETRLRLSSSWLVLMSPACKKPKIAVETHLAVVAHSSSVSAGPIAVYAPPWAGHVSSNSTLAINLSSTTRANLNLPTL
nr:hypothetical protein CFP56_21213 [Quercus suber]